jgi:peptidoglycan-associated lipoprotein
MNIKKAFQAATWLVTLFVACSVSADDIPASGAYAQPSADCRTSFGMQTGWINNVIGSLGFSFSLPPNGDCKDFMTMQALNQKAGKAAQAKDYETFAEASNQANRHMRRIWPVEKALRDYVPKPETIVTEETEAVVVLGKPITVEATVLFDFDKSVVKPEYTEQLQTFVKRIGDNYETIHVDGHTDERGSLAYNDALGMRRANATKEILVRLGIPQEKIQVTSYGETQPADPAHNHVAWRKNRRSNVYTSIRGYKTLHVVRKTEETETQAQAKAKHDLQTAEAYLRDYEKDLRDVERQYANKWLGKQEEDKAAWAFLRARKHVSGAKVRMTFANWRLQHDKGIYDLTLDEATYWAQTLSEQGEDILAHKIAQHHDLVYYQGQYIEESTRPPNWRK